MAWYWQPLWADPRTILWKILEDEFYEWVGMLLILLLLLPTRPQPDSHSLAENQRTRTFLLLLWVPRMICVSSALTLNSSRKRPSTFVRSILSRPGKGLLQHQLVTNCLEIVQKREKMLKKPCKHWHYRPWIGLYLPTLESHFGAEQDPMPPQQNSSCCVQ